MLAGGTSLTLSISLFHVVLKGCLVMQHAASSCVDGVVCNSAQILLAERDGRCVA